MMTKTQQVHALRRAVEQGSDRWLQSGGVWLGFTGLLAGLGTDRAVWYIAGLCGLGIALSAWWSSRHLRRAYRALAGATASAARVTIEHEPGEAGGTALVACGPDRHWRIRFESPGWQPAAGSVLAEVLHADDAPWPALLILPQAIVYPLRRPRLHIEAPAVAATPGGR